MPYKDPERKKLYNQEYFKKNRYKCYENSNKFYSKNKIEINNKRRLRFANDLEYRNKKLSQNKVDKLWRRSGIRKSKFQELYNKQNGCCGICFNFFSPVFKNLPRVDHDHNCCSNTQSCGNCVRGLLCFNCNTGLGFFNDNIQLISSLILYLNKDGFKIVPDFSRYKNNSKGIRRDSKDIARKHQYGLKQDVFEWMLLQQDFKCCSCRKSIQDSNINVDHNHSTGIIRGLLCRSCNLGIGQFKENIELLQAAIKYLHTWSLLNEA